MPSVGEKRLEQERRRRVQAAAVINEIAPIPPILNVARRVACESDPALWLSTYLPQVFFSEFSDSQRRFIAESWRTICANGSKNIEAYRGFGKTSILSGLLLMCLLTGRIKHAYYIVAQGGRGAKQAAQWFAAALYEEYDRPTCYARALVADYPESCYPIQRRRGIANRPLKYKGEPCDIVMTPDRLRLPTIAVFRRDGRLFVDPRAASRGVDPDSRVRKLPRRCGFIRRHSDRRERSVGKGDGKHYRNGQVVDRVSFR